MTRYIWSPELYTISYKFAATHHRNQKYPGTDLPYIMHLSFVAMEVMAALARDDREDGNLAVQCAVLHDVLEDTEATYTDVRDKFGPGVAEGVSALTKSATLPKSQQMADSLRRLLLQPPAVRMVKLADRIVNLQEPPHYWTNEKIIAYREEAIVIHRTLHDADRYLGDRLQVKIDEYRQFIQ
jgi:guanosine-3',5'-bis(diphosphate) 3'-pyrophosphohydrolase